MGYLLVGWLVILVLGAIIRAPSTKESSDKDSRAH